MLDGRKLICRTWGQAHHRVDAWIRRPSRSHGQRLRSHRWGYVGAVREGLWWRMGLFCAGQLWQLTYHLWGKKKETLGIMSCDTCRKSISKFKKISFCTYLSIQKYFAVSWLLVLWLQIATQICFSHLFSPSSCTTESDRELSSDVPRSESQNSIFYKVQVENNAFHMKKKLKLLLKSKIHLKVVTAAWVKALT